MYDLKQVSKFKILKMTSKTEILNHLPSLLYIEKSSEYFQIVLKKRFLRDLSGKIKKNIESQAKNEGFGWLKHEILPSVQGSLCFSFNLVCFGARTHINTGAIL